MPIFEYRCNACGALFEAIVHASSSTPECPKCSGSDLEKQLSVFAVGSSGPSSRAMDALPEQCRSCGDPRGPGACGMR